MKRKLFVTALALVLLAVAVGVHVLNREARADTFQHVKMEIINWNDVFPYDVQGIVTLLDSEEEILDIEEMEPDENLRWFTAAFTNPSSTATHVKILWNEGGVNWDMESPQFRNLTWPNLPAIVITNACWQ